MKAGAERALLSITLLCAAAIGASSRADEPAAQAGFALRRLSPENILLLDTTKGRIVVEILPELAPEVTAEVRELARAGAFDGTAFDRVVDGFRAEIALPRTEPAVAPPDPDPSAEPAFEHPPVSVAVADSDRGRTGVRAAFALNAAPYDGGSAFGIYKGAPVAERAEPATSELWATHCPGVASYEPSDEPGQPARIFIMRGEAPALDGRARPWGMVVSGLEVVYDLAAGDAQTPGFEPDRLLAARIAADGTWTSFEAREDLAVLTLLDETGPGFAEFIASLREELGRAPRLCEIRLPLGPPASGLLVRASGAPP